MGPLVPDYLGDSSRTVTYDVLNKNVCALSSSRTDSTPHNDDEDEDNNIANADAIVDTNRGRYIRDEIFRLATEVGRLCDRVRRCVWTDDVNASANNGSIFSTGEREREEMAGAVARVFVRLLVLARLCGMDLRTCMVRKMELNARKYPVDLCRGKALKYTAYSDQTKITSEIQTQRTMPTDRVNMNQSNEETSTITGMMAHIRKFAEDREWSRHHRPRSLCLALMGEMGELAELFQWDGDSGGTKWSEERSDHVGQELADVSIYLHRLADVCGLDLGSLTYGLLSSNGDSIDGDDKE